MNGFRHTLEKALTENVGITHVAFSALDYIAAEPRKLIPSALLLLKQSSATTGCSSFGRESLEKVHNGSNEDLMEVVDSPTSTIEVYVVNDSKQDRGLCDFLRSQIPPAPDSNRRETVISYGIEVHSSHYKTLISVSIVISP